MCEYLGNLWESPSSRKAMLKLGGRSSPRLHSKDLSMEVAPVFLNEFEAYEPDIT